jgi:hypothetical protein
MASPGHILAVSYVAGVRGLAAAGENDRPVSKPC